MGVVARGQGLRHATNGTGAPGAGLTARRRVLAGVAAAVVAGVGSAVQARVNSGLAGRLHDGLGAALLSNIVATILSGALLLASPPGRAGLRRAASGLRSRRLRPWEFLGGICGALYLASQGFSVNALGLAVFTVAVVAGQSGGGLAVDVAGVAPGGRRPITAARAIGAALTVMAVLLAAREGVHTGAEVALAVLPLVAGATLAFQGAVNGRVQQATGGVLPAVFLNVLIGTAALMLAYVGVLAVRGWPTGTLPSEPWLYTGGALGIAFIAISVSVVRHTGVLLLSLGTVAGQLVGALVLDWLAPGPAGTPKLAALLGTVLTLAAVAIALLPDLAGGGAAGRRDSDDLVTSVRVDPRDSDEVAAPRGRGLARWGAGTQPGRRR